MLEAILESDHTAARDLTLLVVRGPFEGLDVVEVELGGQGLVDDLDGSDDVVVGGVAVLLLDLLEHSKSLCRTWVHCLPLRRVHALARVVKSVLRARDTV